MNEQWEITPDAPGVGATVRDVWQHRRLVGFVGSRALRRIYRRTALGWLWLIINPLFPLAPKPVLLCEDTSIIGVPFYLMERRRGFIVRHKVPARIGENLELRRRLSETVIDTLVALHAVEIGRASCRERVWIPV